MRVRRGEAAPRVCYTWCVQGYSPGPRPIASWLVAALVVLAAPVMARGADGLERIEDIARGLPTGPGGRETPEELLQRVTRAREEVHRIQLGAAPVKYDRHTGTFLVRLVTSDGRLIATMKTLPKGAYVARTRDGLEFEIRRQEVTIHELDVVEGRELMRDIELRAPRSHALHLMHGLVAVCELRVVAGADGFPAREIIEIFKPSIDVPLEGMATTHLVRVALDSVTLQDAASGRIYRRIDAGALASSGPTGDARRR